jgi:hypothetical protein
MVVSTESSLDRSAARRDLIALISIAAATIVVHLFVADGYGFHRDELATLDDSRHLDWGYVAYPPVTPFFGWMSLHLFGTSLVGFRLFAALASAASVFLTGWLAREVDGRRPAQILAAAAAIPFCLATGALMQYVAFDYLFWVLASFFLARLCKTEDPRWWIAIGGTIGLGMLTKYSMLFAALGIAVGVTLTNLRRHLRSRCLWLGVACSLLFFLPNLIWQIRHDFISLEFLRHIHERDIRIGRTTDFLPDQIKLNLFALPIAIIGLAFYLLSPAARRFRALAWFYIIPLVLFFASKGRGYYLMPTYPVLFAGGAVWLEKAFERFRPVRRGLAYGTIGLLLLFDTVFAGAVSLPIAPINSQWWAFAAGIDEDLPEEIGWPELVETVARVRDSLSVTDRERLGVLAGNYGEAGAINLYGPQHGLPRAISGTNSFWLRGYGNPPPQTVIALGLSREFLERHFDSCKVIAQTWNRFGVRNEETVRHPEIFVCRGLHETWAEFWKNFRRFG